MKKNIFFVIQFMVVATALFAEKSLDDAILEASRDISKKEFVKESRLLIRVYDFPSKDTTKHVANQFKNALVNSGINLVSRDIEITAELDKELYEQHNSGNYDPKKIKSIGKRHGADEIVFVDFEKPNKLNVSMVSVEKGTVDFSGIYYFSPDKKVGLGFGAEVNKNSHDLLSPAGSFSFDYSFGKVSLGFKMFVSFDINEKNNNVIFLEPLTSLRFYLASNSGVPGTGVFLEGLGGATISLVNFDNHLDTNVGGGFGYRAAFQNLYIEPEIRFGYPYMFGAGLSAGFRF